MRKLRHEEIPRPGPDELKTLKRHPVVVVVDNVRSLYNVGSIFRTSDAALVGPLHLTGFTGTPENRGLHKTALGAQDTVPWSYERDPVPLLGRLKESGYTLAALEITNTPMEPSALETGAFPLCLLIGNELTGVRNELLTMSDLALEIPQYGAKQSLNVAVAYGIAIFDIVRRYRSLFVP